MDASHLLNYFFAAVWLINGLFCKVLDLTPRHRLIVGRILGSERARLITGLIGIAEICMTVWILSGIAPRVNAIVQIAVIAVMNVVEFFRARDLLLFGRANALIATLLVLLIAYNAFWLN